MKFILKILKVMKIISFLFADLNSTDVNEFIIYSDLHDNNLQSFMWTDELKIL